MDWSSFVRPHKTKEEAHAAAMQRGARCYECPFYGAEQGPVMPEIVPNAKITAIGEGPDSLDIDVGKPFQDTAGDLYTDALQAGGISRSEVTTTNVLLCRPRPPEDLRTFLERQSARFKKATISAAAAGTAGPPPPMSPIEACRPRLERDIADSASPMLLAIGAKALEAVATHYNVPYGTGADAEGRVLVASIKQQHGAPIKMADGRIVASSLHPRFALRERAYFDIVRQNITRAAAIAARGYKIDWAQPAYKLFPDIDTIEATCARILQHRPQVAFDIEADSASTLTCRVRCVGFCTQLPGEAEETVLVVPFAWMDGRDYWPTRELFDRAQAAVRRVLDACQLIAHNGAFDTSVCQRLGFMSRDPELKPSVMRRWSDTLLGHHDTISNDLPHDLGFVTRQYTEAPLWKKDVDHKAAEGVARDDDLHLYNARDCLATWRIWPKIQADVAAAGAQKQYETDVALAPITREMTALGFPVDEVYRGYLSLEFNKVVDDFREKFQQASGKPSINPRAPQQIGTWLYEDLKLTPPLNPQGYEWEEGQEWSTSTPALLKILDEVGVEQKVRTALEYLMRFRASETIRNRYIDKLGVAFHPDDPILAQAGRAPALGIFEERPALSVAHTSWKIHVVPSGRWSSAPNWQNIPARAFKARDVDPEHRDMLTGEMRTNPKTGKPYPEVVPTNLRRLVVAPPGHVFVGGDFSQIELRLYAVMAQDKLVLQAFREQRRCTVTGKMVKIDPHTLNAATLFAPSASQIMATYDALAAEGTDSASEESKAELKYLRTIAKRFVFLEVYGGSEDKLFSVMSAERDKATLEKVFKNLKERQVIEWHQRWHDAHPETKAWQAAKANDVKRYGYVEALLDCRRRWFLNGATKKNAPPNHEIQGTAAAVANDAVLRVVEAIPFRSWSPWTGLCLQVHDQLIAIVPESRADEAQQIMAKALKYNIRGIDIFADVSCSKNWAKQM